MDKRIKSRRPDQKVYVPRARREDKGICQSDSVEAVGDRSGISPSNSYSESCSSSRPTSSLAGTQTLEKENASWNLNTLLKTWSAVTKTSSNITVDCPQRPQPRNKFETRNGRMSAGGACEFDKTVNASTGNLYESLCGGLRVRSPSVNDEYRGDQIPQKRDNVVGRYEFPSTRSRASDVSIENSMSSKQFGTSKRPSAGPVTTTANKAKQQQLPEEVDPYLLRQPQPNKLPFEIIREMLKKNGMETALPVAVTATNANDIERTAQSSAYSSGIPETSSTTVGVFDGRKELAKTVDDKDYTVLEQLYYPLYASLTKGQPAVNNSQKIESYGVKSVEESVAQLSGGQRECCLDGLPMSYEDFESGQIVLESVNTVLNDTLESETGLVSVTCTSLGDSSNHSSCSTLADKGVPMVISNITNVMPMPTRKNSESPPQSSTGSSAPSSVDPTDLEVQFINEQWQTPYPDLLNNEAMMKLFYRTPPSAVTASKPVCTTSPTSTMQNSVYPTSLSSSYSTTTQSAYLGSCGIVGNMQQLSSSFASGCQTFYVPQLSQQKLDVAAVSNLLFGCTSEKYLANPQSSVFGASGIIVSAAPQSALPQVSQYFAQQNQCKLGVPLPTCVANSNTAVSRSLLSSSLIKLSGSIGDTLTSPLTKCSTVHASSSGASLCESSLEDTNNWRNALQEYVSQRFGSSSESEGTSGNSSRTSRRHHLSVDNPSVLSTNSMSDLSKCSGVEKPPPKPESVAVVMPRKDELVAKTAQRVTWAKWGESSHNLEEKATSNQKELPEKAKPLASVLEVSTSSKETEEQSASSDAPLSDVGQKASESINLSDNAYDEQIANELEQLTVRDHSTVAEEVSVLHCKPEKPSTPLGEITAIKPVSSKETEGDLVNSWEDFCDDSDNLISMRLAGIDEALSAIKTGREAVDHLEFRPVLADEGDLGHVLEIYAFPKESRTEDLIENFSKLGYKDFGVKWVDETHALVVFASQAAALAALTGDYAYLKLRPLSQADPQSKQRAVTSMECVQPFRPRPSTNAAIARRLVEGHLGKKSGASPEQRQRESKQLSEAKEKKKLFQKTKEDVWEGNV